MKSVRSNTMIVCLAFALALSVSSCAGRGPREYPLPLLPGERVVDIAAGYETCLATVEDASGKSWVLVDGRRLGPYEAVGISSVALEGRAWCFLARTGTGYAAMTESGAEGPYIEVGIAASGEGRVEYSGKDERGIWIRTRERLFGPYPDAESKTGVSNGRAAFVVEDSKGETLIYGTTIEGPYSAIHPGVKVSSDGARAAFSYAKGGNDASYTVRWNGADKGPFMQAAAVMSEDGRSLAIASMATDGTLGLERCDRDGTWASVDLGDATAFAGALMGAELVYGVRDADGTARVFAGATAVPGAYGDISRWAVFGSRWSAIASLGEEYYYLRSGEPSGPWAKIVRSGSSGDVDYATVLDEEGDAFVLLSGRRFGPWNMVGDLTYCPDEPERAVWVASADSVSWKAYRDGEELLDLGSRFFVRRAAALAFSDAFAYEYIDVEGQEAWIEFRPVGSDPVRVGPFPSGTASLLDGLSSDGACVAYWAFDGTKAAEPRLLFADGRDRPGTIIAKDGRPLLVVSVEAKGESFVIGVAPVAADISGKKAR